MSDNPSETSNYLRFLAVFVDIGTERLLKLLYHYQPKETINTYLSSGKVRSKLEKVLHGQKFKKVTSGYANVDEFDVSVLGTLLDELFTGIVPPNIATDLKKLRSMRNKLVGHRHKASLTSEETEQIFGELEIILVRITGIVKPNEEEQLARKIEAYKTMKLDSSQKDMYLTKINEWHDELQEKVKELLEQTNDLKLFFKGVSDKYSSYVALLLHAGPLVLTAYLNEAIRMQRQTLAEFLIYNRELLQTELNTQDGIKQLYPRIDEGETRPNTDMNTWDLYVLANVILIVFRRSMKRKERRNIEGILRARENYAAEAIEALDRERFSHCCENLVHNIMSLAEDLDEDIESQCDELIKAYRSGKKDRDDLDKYMKRLKCHDLGIVSLSEKYEDHIKKLKQAVEETDEARIDFKKWPEIEIKIQVTCEDPEKRKQAELLIQKSLGYSNEEIESGQEISALLEIRQKIENMPSVHVVAVKQNSVILAVRCESKQGLLQLIDFIVGQGFKENLNESAFELDDIFNETFCLQGYFTLESVLESVRNAHSDNFQSEQDEGFILPIACSSPEENRKFERAVQHREHSEYRGEIYERERKYFSDRESMHGISPDSRQNLNVQQNEIQQALNNELRTEKERVVALQHEKSIVEREKMEAERQLEEAEVRIDALEKEWRNVEKIIEENQRREREMRSQIAELEVENSRLAYQIYEIETTERDIERTKFDSQSAMDRTTPSRDTTETIHQIQKLQAQLEQTKQQFIQRENTLLARLEEAEEARLKATKQATSKAYSQIWKSEKADLKDYLEKSEKERKELERVLRVAKKDNMDMSTKLFEMKIKMSEVEENYYEKLSKTSSEEYILKQEIEDLKEDLATEVRLRKEYILRNAVLAEEIRAIRERLDIVDQEQTLNKVHLEKDLDRVYRRNSNMRRYQPRYRTPLLQTKKSGQFYMKSPLQSSEFKFY
ncbi:myosin-3-like isoform X2 [Mercenaria mercenaria]|uniref:myosin-3-like isoform X2 n=1 Tax=Mercenaria mercenaria TaxID=6596 RepID=UPI00234F79E4|nr:myosin-3-like isoform X2 [Mercenaria mercenaria]